MERRPAGTAPEIVAGLHREITVAVTFPEYTTYVAFLGGVIANTPAESPKLIGVELDRWTKVVKQAGVRAD